MNDDELHARLRRHDPSRRDLAPVVSVHPVGGPEAATLLEQIMNTPLGPELLAASSPASSPGPSRRRSRLVLAVAAGAVIVVGVAAFALTRNDDKGGTAAPTSITLALPAAAVGPASSMCIRVDAFQPPAGTVAFQGKVTSVAAGKVTLTVSHWYAGGTAAQVVLNAPDTSHPDPVLEGGVTFTVGDQFLVAATDGNVVGCGVSAPVSPELTALYAKWFPA